MDERISQELNNILTSANYQQKVKDVRAAIESETSAIIQVSGLDYNQAKTNSYYSASTHIPQEKKHVQTTMTFISDFSCGKSNAMLITECYCCNPVVVSAKNQTFPSVRDKVLWAIKSEKKTMIIEEADRCKHSGELEEFIFSSYDRTTAKGSIKRWTPASQGTMLKDYPYDIFVPFIVHRRHRYFDAANESRGIEIYFEPKPGKFPKAESIQIENADKMHFVADLNLTEATQPDDIEGRVWDRQKLLLEIAFALGDTNWIQWMMKKMKEDSLKLRDGREYEPRTAIFLSAVAASKRNDDGSFKPTSLTEIKNKAFYDFDLKVSNKNVKAELRDLGITFKRPRGVAHIYLGESIVRDVSAKLNLDADELLGEKPPSSSIMPPMPGC